MWPIISLLPTGRIDLALMTPRDRAKTAQAFAMSDFSSTIAQLMVRLA